jgi:hypothetical protein
MKITQSCAGHRSNITPSPHQLCQTCALYQYAAPDGIFPRWIELSGGAARCDDRVDFRAALDGRPDDVQ